VDGKAVPVRAHACVLWLPASGYLQVRLRVSVTETLCMWMPACMCMCIFRCAGMVLGGVCVGVRMCDTSRCVYVRGARLCLREGEDGGLVLADTIIAAVGQDEPSAAGCLSSADTPPAD
jgi:hypothetical protein